MTKGLGSLVTVISTSEGKGWSPDLLTLHLGPSASIVLRVFVEHLLLIRPISMLLGNFHEQDIQRFLGKTD
jgi:hypothetical protein